MLDEQLLFEELQREFRALHAKIDHIHQQVAGLERKVAALAPPADLAARLKELADLIRAGPPAP